MGPNEFHKHLNAFEGTWKAACKMWQKPGAPPMEYGGDMTNTWELGGRFLKQSFKAPLFGGVFEGIGYFGYNIHANRYEGVWMDTASTIMQLETGSVDATGKVFSMSGEFPSPMGGTMKKRTVITVRSQDEHLFEMYFTAGNFPEMKMLEAVYTRVK